MIAYQEILEAIAVLSEEDQEELFELIRKRRIENRRSQIATSAQAVLQAVDEGKVVKGSFADIKAYLLKDEEE
ncbi:hypothetical protein WEU38_00960 [Cyanobacterium aponinum AL20118]|uniref:HigA protein (Antitoxin to HigB) n=1 Tax=Cyanobacterium aponinum AL20115 TaxID=3090662 RepID=A0AAF0ZEW7_9CHRO|nr:hypothetical protein [Cyanobacterium aponinum]PHV63129.1 hypothetical protein CSQ80_07165 [Cyanobacterium aponinum IPPAS B-1201]WPF88872.1 hypothetical protein SAY89_00965 [Cyanobacterium aponinum AL20115]